MGPAAPERIKPATGLLCDSDPKPVEVFNKNGKSPYVLTCEHAGRQLPKSLGDMGVSPQDLERHIAWDIGAEGLSRRLAKFLDAPLILQRFSRLVIDCNRPVEAADAVPEISDGTAIPANQGLKDPVRHLRAEAIHTPYHLAISQLLDTRQAAGRATALVSIHSFTPRLAIAPSPRPWELGLLFNRHERLSRQMHDALTHQAPHISYTFNQPYQVSDESDYTIPIHGERRGIPNMLVEVRNDQIATPKGEMEWSILLGDALKSAAARL